jgi:hypothetical protein
LRREEVALDNLVHQLAHWIAGPARVREDRFDPGAVGKTHRRTRGIGDQLADEIARNLGLIFEQTAL